MIDSLSSTNLYRFITIIGIALVFYSATAVFYIFDNAYKSSENDNTIVLTTGIFEEITKWKNKIIVLDTTFNENIKQAFNDSINSCILKTTGKVDPIRFQAEVKGILSLMNNYILSFSANNQIKSDWLDTKKELAEKSTHITNELLLYEDSTFYEISIVTLFICFIFGIILSIAGLLLWYFRNQKYVDRAIKAEAKKAYST